MRIAMLGGSFNPPHAGHLFLADEVRCRLGYDKILLIPACTPPHKALAPGASAAQRLEMLVRCTQDVPYFAVDSCEIDRRGVSYTYDTVRYLNERYASVLDGKIGLIMGDDLAADFNTWAGCDMLPVLTDIILARRMIAEPEAARQEFSVRHIELGNSILPISSSDIRSRIKNGAAWRYLVPDAVYRYIVNGKLYGFTDS
ncbi:MAG TPA: nicotinate (nicotinamide) nucleotide adenylyltransferase [Candidatus Treponema faecavium]|nr:nicotinate (nicotinamide) nucleotide adenylyltransferase [Candidatus Treponema faecavium]